MTISDGQPEGRWFHYLQWTGGQREKRPLGASIDLPQDPRLWIESHTSRSAVSMQPGWSQAARHAWLDGTAVPSAAKIFRDICKRIEYFVDLPREHAKGTGSTLALWTLLTYCFHAWPAVPYLYVGGPLGSGKSRVFEILSRLVFRPLVSSNMTAAALFRTLHNNGGTLLLDEAERLKQVNNPDVARYS